MKHEPSSVVASELKLWALNDMQPSTAKAQSPATLASAAKFLALSVMQPTTAATQPWLTVAVES